MKLWIAFTASLCVDLLSVCVYVCVLLGTEKFVCVRLRKHTIFLLECFPLQCKVSSTSGSYDLPTKHYGPCAFISVAEKDENQSQLPLTSTHTFNGPALVTKLCLWLKRSRNEKKHSNTLTHFGFKPAYLSPYRTSIRKIETSKRITLLFIAFF